MEVFSVEVVNKKLGVLKALVKEVEPKLKELGLDAKSALKAANATMAKAKAQLNQNAILVLLSKPIITNPVKGKEWRLQLGKIIKAVEKHELVLIDGLLKEAIAVPGVGVACCF